MKTCMPVSFIRSFTQIVGIAGASALFAISVIAQDAPTRPAEPTPSPAPSPEEQPRGMATTDTVVVTANKIEENIREVPSSITAVDTELIDNLHATQLADFAAYVPSLQVNSQGAPGRVTIALRGLTPLTSGSTIGTYIDETPVGSSGLYQSASVFQLDLLPDDIARVEILRGPQGTLYGANTLGGLIKYVTRDPSLGAYEFRLGGGISAVEGASDPGWDVRAGLNLPLVRDRLGLRASYARNEIPGVINNVVNGEKDINSGTQQSGRVALLWEPNNSVRVQFAALGQRIETDNNMFVSLNPVTLRPNFGDLTNQVFINEPFEKEIGLVSLTVDWDFGWASVTSATSYSDISTNQRQDTTAAFGEVPVLFGLGPAGLSSFDVGLHLEKFTQELRLTSRRDSPLFWQLGAYYTYEDAIQTQTALLLDLDGSPYPGLPVLADLAIPSTYEEIAFFANASYRFTDWFKLSAGARYSHNDQDFAQVVTDGVLLGLGTTPGSSEENVYNFMVSPQVQVGKDQLLYLRIASGYQPGGPNVVPLGAPTDVPATVDSSSLTSYELGWKSEYFQNRLLFDVAAYHIDWSDIQTSTNVGGVNVLVNGGQASVNGIELTTAFKVTQEFRIGFSGSYTDARFRNTVASIGALPGDRLPDIPQFQGAITADYYLPLSRPRSEQVIGSGKDGKTTTVAGATQTGGGWNAHFGAGLRMVGDRLSAPESAGAGTPAPYPLDSYAALDLGADLYNKNWTVRVFVKNVTDERAYQTISPISNQITGAVDHLAGVPIPPRTIGIEVDWRF